MRHGFVKVAAATPDIRVADVAYNTQKICGLIDETVKEGAKVVAFPELCVTGYTCGDLFAQEVLLKEARAALHKIARHTKGKDALIFVGVPVAVEGKLYNVAAALNQGKILGLTTKSFLPNYGCASLPRDHLRQGRFSLMERRCPSDRSFCSWQILWNRWWYPQRSAKMPGPAFLPA